MAETVAHQTYVCWCDEAQLIAVCVGLGGVWSLGHSAPSPDWICPEIRSEWLELVGYLHSISGLECFWRAFCILAFKGPFASQGKESLFSSEVAAVSTG